MQGVDCDHGIAQILVADGVQQRGELGDLVRFRTDLTQGRGQCVMLAAHALDTGSRLRSGRVVERARAFRRSYSSAAPPVVVRDFDAKPDDAYL